MRRATTPFPAGLALVLDRSVRRRQGGRVLMGGEPPRVLRLSPAGAAALDRLVGAPAATAAPSPAALRLARTLVDGGLAHPCPAPRPATGVTVVVPVRDRPRELAACLAALAVAGTGGAPAAAVLVVDDGSRDPDAVARIGAEHGARVLRRPVAGGPAAARNAALEVVDTPLIAFLDSDCRAPAGWLDALVGHFDDPLVAAVAPRVRGHGGADPVGPHHAGPDARHGGADPVGPRQAGPDASAPRGADRGVRPGPVARFAAARSPLDLGPRPARVQPGGRVAYVPTAALVVRRAALGGGFDPALRYGEDVDLVWRLHDAGWRIRYDPATVVEHDEPRRWRALVARRFHYGTSAAPLAERHPERLAPLVVHPWSAAVVALGLAGRPRLAAALLGVQSAVLARRLHAAGAGLAPAARTPSRGAGQTLVALGRAATTLALPALAGATLTRRGRRPALLLLAAAPLDELVTRRPALDPLRWTALSIADDAAYGAGVWWGCARRRTTAPLRPHRAAPRGAQPAPAPPSSTRFTAWTAAKPLSIAPSM